MWPATTHTKNVFDPNTPNQQGVSNQRAVAAPWQSLRAHQGQHPTGGEVGYLLKGLFELPGLHVVGKPPKGVIDPPSIRRAGTRPPQTAQPRHV